MTKSSPPELPERKLQRVLNVSRADCLGVLVCSGASLMLSLLGEEWVFAGFAALAVVAGWMEWQGHLQLRSGQFSGMQWLTGAQLCLYTVVVGYCVWKLNHFNATEYWAQVPTAARERFDTQMREAGLDPAQNREEFLSFVNVLVCSVLVFVSTLYQGGLTWWYARQRSAVATALESFRA